MARPVPPVAPATTARRPEKAPEGSPSAALAGADVSGTISESEGVQSSVVDVTGVAGALRVSMHARRNGVHERGMSTLASM